MKVLFLADVVTPAHLTGKKGEVKDLPEKFAKNLIEQRFVILAKEKTDVVNKKSNPGTQ